MEGKLVRLRGFEKSDVAEIMRWVNDEEVLQFLGAGPFTTYPVSSIAEQQFIENAARPSETEKLFVIETLAGGYVGGISLHAINWIDRHAEVGIVIGIKSFWGKGYGSDAMRVLMRLAFDKMNLHRLWLRVFDFNHRAIASYEKCGFKREGLLREHCLRKGKCHDTIVMGVLASEYRAAQAG